MVARYPRRGLEALDLLLEWRQWFQLTRVDTRV